MNAFKKLTTAFLGLACAASLCAAGAFAAQTETTTETTTTATAKTSTGSETYYPDSSESFEKILIFDDGVIGDYAVYGDTYAFAYSGKLAVLYEKNGERQADITNLSSPVSGLDYTESGELLVAFSDGYCTYPNLDTENKIALTGVTVQSPSTYIDSSSTPDGTYYYISDEDASLHYITKGKPVDVATEDGTTTGFEKLKYYDGYAYAVLGGSLYKVVGETAQKVDPVYFDYEATEHISIGDSLTALKSGDYVIKTAAISKGSYYTRIDLEASTGNYFALPEGLDVEECTVAATDKLSCLVLAESGNASIVYALDGNCYLTRTEELSDVSEITSLTNTWTTAAYALDNIGVYASPYAGEVTKIATLQSGTQNAVTVLGQYTDLMGTSYAKITYTSGENTVTGYVVEGMLSPYSFANEENETNEGGDTTFSYSTAVTTVVLVVVIVLLVIIAILYISVISSRAFREKSYKKHSEYEDDDEE